MSLVPLKNTVTITPALGTDEWDRPIPGTPYQLRCRVQEGTKLVRSATGSGGIHGIQAQEVVSVAQIYFDRIPRDPLTGDALGLADTITFTDETGVARTYTPISIEIKRWLNGKATLTVVNV
ncbi:hypothetical protein M655_024825 [Brevibacillus sp. NSP2.1]|uniref:hypothetical protein n=1 Tax=Brevibacillus sp. NSP2.1 TaxID=3003229 RepID=UPI00047DB41B|nr:hypothetical protein [Brevibacillus sp. NSP2.1]QHZ58599.1 hypothetical protein M655_024825 [Brevibacillus sp. NSP2.1]